MTLRSRIKHGAALACLAVWMAILSGCQAPASAAPAPARSYSGDGSGEARLEGWSGPGILHITAGEGSQPFRAERFSGLDYTSLVEAQSSVDTYRGFSAGPGEQVTIRLSGDRAWKVELYPLDAGGFDTFELPGTLQGEGSRVIRFEEKPGVATFDTTRAQDFDAWAIGRSQEWQHLTITPSGDYQGRSVLPSYTSAIIVSARGPWSLSVLAPCCENIPGKPDN